MVTSNLDLANYSSIFNKKIVYNFKITTISELVKQQWE